jgi:DNA-binding NarL/FixJ family response regulator
VPRRRAPEDHPLPFTPAVPAGEVDHRRIAADGTDAAYVPPRYPEGVVVVNESSDLTDGERALLTLLVTGRLIPEIATILGVSLVVVHRRLDRLRDRRGCRNRVELIIVALREGWLTGRTRRDA